MKRVSVTEGDSVHLSTDRPKIERDDEIQWRCGDEIIAEIKEGTGKTHDGADGRFRDRLELNDQTGDLTIKNSTTEHEGDYNLKIRSRKGNRNWTYRVIIRGESHFFIYFICLMFKLYSEFICRSFHSLSLLLTIQHEVATSPQYFIQLYFISVLCKKHKHVYRARNCDHVGRICSRNVICATPKYIWEHLCECK